MVIKQKPFTEALFFCEQVLGESMLFEEGFGFFCFFFNSESILCLFGGEVNLRCYFLLTKKATDRIFVGYSEIINSAGRFVQIAKPEIEIAYTTGILRAVTYNLSDPTFRAFAVKFVIEVRGAGA
jgi:hypothetical protein